MKEMIFAAVVFLMFLSVMVFSIIYSDTIRIDCREKAMEKGIYSSAEIQVLCR
jgi:hypothetical protein